MTSDGRDVRVSEATGDGRQWVKLVVGVRDLKQGTRGGPSTLGYEDAGLLRAIKLGAGLHPALTNEGCTLGAGRLQVGYTWGAGGVQDARSGVWNGEGSLGGVTRLRGRSGKRGYVAILSYDDVTDK